MANLKIKQSNAGTLPTALPHRELGIANNKLYYGNSSNIPVELSIKGHTHTPNEVGAVAAIASSTDNAAVRFNGAAGAIQNSTIIIGDGGELTVPGTIKTAGKLSFAINSNEAAKASILYNTADECLEFVFN